MNRLSFAGVICLSSLAGAALVRAEDKPWVAPARAAAKKNPIPASAAALDVGKKVFERECLSCHGPTGKGDGPKAAQLKTQPHDLSAPPIAGQSDGALFWKLTTGKNPMPKFDELLTEDQRWSVLHYIRSFAAPAAMAKTSTEISK